MLESETWQIRIVIKDVKDAKMVGFVKTYTVTSLILIIFKLYSKTVKQFNFEI